MTDPNPDFITIIRHIPDPRIESKCAHKLVDILVITLCAVAAGAESWEDIGLFAEQRKEWLGQFLELPSGIPSTDTIARVLSILDPVEFEKALQTLIELIRQSVRSQSHSEIIALDGKVLRRSFDQATGKAAIHMVSAWAVEAGVVLGQCKVNEKSNEITAVPELIRRLAIQGATLTTDALNTQKSIAETIIDQKGQYVMALKGNHGQIHQDVEFFFDQELQSKTPEKEFTLSTYETSEKAHGRVEIRRCYSCDQIDWLSSKSQWKHLQSIARIECERWIGEKKSLEIRYYLCSIPSNPQEILRCVRGHWGVENSLHWVLDVTFQEDQSRIRVKYAAENFSRVRRLALVLLKKATEPARSSRRKPLSIKGKRKLCAWNAEYLMHALFGAPCPNPHPS